MNVVTHQDPGKCCPLACRLYIQATGKLDQNVFVERFNQTYRDKVLGAGVFESIDQVRAITEDCLLEIQRGAGARLPMPDDAPHLHAERVTAGNFCF
jgi:hypothetical protein